MDIFSLLPVLFFLLFVVITILRTRKRMKQLAKNGNRSPIQRSALSRSKKDLKEKQPGLKNILLDTLAEIQREIKASQEAKQQDTKTTKREKFTRDTLRKSVSSKLLWSKDSPAFQPPPLPSEKIKKKKTIPQPQPVSKTTEVHETKPKTPLESFRKPSIKQLRNAVVWAEILAPPIALRKDQDLL